LYLVNSCLLASQSAVQWVDFDDQTEFGWEPLPFGWSVSGPIGGFGYSGSVFGEQLPFGWSVSGPMG
jgi:hypothetical protein